MILVDAAGENMIAVAPGANERLTAGRVTELLADRVAAGTVILASLEVPLAAVSAAAAAAAAADGAVLVVNPAPGQALPPDLVDGVILTPNEGELRRLPPAGDDGAAEPDEDAAVACLLGAGARAVIVTRGSRGATLFRSGREPASFPLRGSRWSTRSARATPSTAPWPPRWPPGCRWTPRSRPPCRPARPRAPARAPGRRCPGPATSPRCARRPGLSPRRGPQADAMRPRRMWLALCCSSTCRSASTVNTHQHCCCLSPGAPGTRS